tara:strand:- start:167 stop:1738 length:1572 start_codon:yes stop_codon:yes gene_type:complete
MNNLQNNSILLSFRNNLSLIIAALPLLIFVLLAQIDLDIAKNVTEIAKHFALNRLGGIWLWMVVCVFFVAVTLALSPVGSIKLGGAKTKPSLSIFEWCSVLICTLLAGGGVFWSAAEPLIHFLTPATYFSQYEGNTESAIDQAFAVSFLHWGFLAWALVGSTIAITFSLLAQKGFPLRPRTLLIPISSVKISNSLLGDFADGFCVVAAIAGTVGPLGFLSLQLSNAAGRLTWLSDSLILQVFIVIALTIIFSISTVSGIQKGIKFLSKLNIWLTIILALLLILLGPTLWIFKHFASSMILYLKNFSTMALPDENNSWVQGWTIFYWGWFLGYAPLMGLFTAGISKGRTIRELVLVIAIVCPLITNLWFVVLGGNGIYSEINNPGLITSEFNSGGSAAVFFAILNNLPISNILIFLGLLLVILFMSTSADSISYAAAIVLSGQEVPPKKQRLFWAVLIGLLTISLLRIGADTSGQTSIDALQSFIILTAIPVTPILLTTLYTAPVLAFKEYKNNQKNLKSPKAL